MSSSRLPLLPIVFGLFMGLSLSGIFATLALEAFPSNSIWLVLAGLAGIWVGFIGTVVAVLAAKNLPISAINLAFDWRKDLMLGLGLGLVGQLVLVQLVYLPVRILEPRLIEDVSAPADALISAFSGWGLILGFIGLCILAPLAEELFFRGYVQSALAPRLRMAGAALVSAILFGLIHFQPLQTPALVAFGLLLSLVVARTGRLGPAIVGHGVFNGITLISLAVY